MIEYKKVTDLEVLDKPTENTYAIVEDNGTFKRMSGDKLGGGGVKTAIIKAAWYDEYVNMFATGGGMEASSEDNEYSCINMNFEEAYKTLVSGQPMTALVMDFDGEAPFILPCEVTFPGLSIDGTHIVIAIAGYLNLADDTYVYYWTEEYGVTNYNPFLQPS